MPRRRLTDGQVTEIRSRVEAGHTLRAVAADYGVAFTTIRNVATRGYRGYRNQYSRGSYEPISESQTT